MESAALSELWCSKHFPAASVQERWKWNKCLHHPLVLFSQKRATEKWAGGGSYLPTRHPQVEDPPLFEPIRLHSQQIKAWQGCAVMSGFVSESCNLLMRPVFGGCLRPKMFLFPLQPFQKLSQRNVPSIYCIKSLTRLRVIKSLQIYTCLSLHNLHNLYLNYVSGCSCQ